MRNCLTCLCAVLAGLVLAAVPAAGSPVEELCHAACEGAVDRMKELLRAAGSGARPDSGETPLHFAARCGQVEAARILLAKGARVNAKRGDGNMPLHEALVNGMNEAAMFLVSRGARVNAPSVSGEMPLHLAARIGDPALVRALLRRGAKVNARDESGETPLHYAAAAGRAGAAKLLVRKGARVTEAGVAGETALHLASRAGSEETVRVLVAEGAPVNAADIGGGTALHYAAASGSAGLVRYLLVMGAEPDAKDAKGETPVKLAAKHRADISRAGENGYREIIRILIAAGADPADAHIGEAGAASTGAFRYMALSFFPVTNLIGYPYWKASEAARRAYPDLRPIMRGVMMIVSWGLLVAGLAIYLVLGRSGLKDDPARRGRLGIIVSWLVIISYILNLLFAVVVVSTGWYSIG